MSWKKYFRPVNSALPAPAAYNADPSSAVSKFSSWLPEYYQGPPNRIMRYLQYDQMDMDHEISAALDTLADFSTHLDEETGIPFTIRFLEDASPSEIEVLDKSLRQWCNLNEFDRRIFRIFRSVLKFGDQFFVRNPETYKLHWIDPSTVEKVLVNESQGKEIESFFVKDLDLNLQALTASNMNRKTNRGYNSADTVFPSVPYTGQVGGGGYGNMSSYGGVDYAEGEAFQLDSAHMVHLSLSEGMTSSWPFGISILETVFKVYKQKELLEDSILIYRIHRAPERRIFYIDTGTMPPNKAAQYLERVRYEVQQKRIPSRTGGGANVTDAAYNPLSSLEDYYFAVSADGRGSKVETLPGGENLGCFSLDTKVKLLDGRDLSIADISEELSQGKELWTYSCHPVTGEIAPGLISWAGKTKSDAQVMKLTLDNGEEIVCTPDHKFPIKGRGFVEAKDLAVNQSMIPIYTDKKEISEFKKLDYEKVYCPHNDTWEFTHRMVMDFLESCGVRNEMIFDSSYEDFKKDVRHHVDFNRYNNSPNNLVWMSWGDHKSLHSSHGFTTENQKLGTKAAKKAIDKMKIENPEKYDEMIQSQVEARQKWYDSLSYTEKAHHKSKISTGIKHYFDNLTNEDRERRAKVSATNAMLGTKRMNWLIENDKDFREYFSQCIKNNWKNLRANPEKYNNRSKKISEANIKRWKIDGYYDRIFENQKIKYDIIMYERFTELFINNPVSLLKDMRNILENDTEFMDHFNYINDECCHSNTKLTSFHERKIIALLNCFNINWDKFKIVHNPIKVDEELLLLKDAYVSSGYLSQSEFVEEMKKKDIPEFKSMHLIMKSLKSKGINTFGEFKEYATYQNHRVVSIEYLDEKCDVGTLTIDSDEKYHDYHTYALSAGIFAKNSIDDLKYFNNKMMRALGVPSGYLPTGPEDGTNAYNDGRVGAAFIQEFRFSKVCQRYQRLISPVFDREFKLFLKHRGVEIDSGMFEIKFHEPQNFSEYRQLELDNAYANLYNSVAGNEHLSRRFALKKYLGLSDTEIADNEKLWREENDVSHLTQDETPGADMRAADVRAPSGFDFGDEFADIEGDIGMEEPAPDIGGAEGEPQI